MSNTNVPTNEASDDDGDERFASLVVSALTFVSLTVCGLCSLLYCFYLLREKQALLEAEVEEEVAAQESEEERRVNIAKGLNVKEWVPDDAPVEESTEGDEDTPPSGETVEAPQPAAPPINTAPASCVMLGSDDCEPLAGVEEEEMAGCAICLSHFKPQQLVCESNNASCQHVFHKDCMVDWLMKHQDSCPMCREVYLLKTD
jgi:hypothetical protein